MSPASAEILYTELAYIESLRTSKFIRNPIYTEELLFCTIGTENFIRYNRLLLYSCTYLKYILMKFKNIKLSLSSFTSEPAFFQAIFLILSQFNRKKENMFVGI